jgi:hypothetical protein
MEAEIHLTPDAEKASFYYFSLELKHEDAIYYFSKSASMAGLEKYLMFE